MPNEFHAVVVGSGFGGSVVAFELSKAGNQVCLLERGKAYPPGSFPRSPREFGGNFWDPSERLYGLFDLWSFRKSEAVVSSGLGGGSLIYANVLIRKPPEWFERVMADGSRKVWPVTYTDLEPHYDDVERMLAAQRFPIEALPSASTTRARAFVAAARQAGLEPSHPLLAVTFRNADELPLSGTPIHEVEPNLHRAPRSTCRHCGECDVGCNYGSKNSLDYNYLSAAKRHGTDIRTLCEVRSFCPLDADHPAKGYKVVYVQHDPEDPTPSHRLPLRTTTCDRLVLAAGTLGTNYLLLKNRGLLPRLSHQLGSGYSTNGDLLAFVIRSRDSLERDSPPRVLDPSRGPVITTSVRVDFPSGGGGLIQDAGYPEFVNWLAEVNVQTGFFPRLAKFVVNRLLAWWLGEPRSEIDIEVARLLGPALLTSSSMPLLGMGCDSADGRVRLCKTRRGGVFLDVDWSRRSSAECFDTLTETCRQLAGAMNGKFLQNPLAKYLARIITVHPLGGCPMGDNADNGVVGPNGEVFRYPGMYVADGSIMPGPVGTNPSLTIAAMARRIALQIVERQTAEPS